MNQRSTGTAAAALVLAGLAALPAGAQSWSVSHIGPRVRYGGRAVAMDVDAVDRLHAAAASESGGLFQTWDGGDSWHHVDSLPPARLASVRLVAGTNVILVGAWPDTRVGNQGGIWRSADGGRTWAKPAGSNPPGCPLSGAYGIDVEPSPTATLYVGTDCGLAVSTDLGVTWRHEAQPGTGTAPLGGVGNPVWSVKAFLGGTALVCADDGVRRWSRTGGFGPLALPGFGCSGSTLGLAASPREPEVVFAINGTQLFESDDQGSTWSSVTVAAPFNRPAWVQVTRAPGNPNEIDVYYGDGGGRAYWRAYRQRCRGAGPGPRCTTGGWTPYGANAAVPGDPSGPDDFHDAGGVAFDSLTGCPLYLFGDSGVHRTACHASCDTGCGLRVERDAGNRRGYSALQLYDVAERAQALGGSDLYVGTQDNYLWGSTDTGVSWPGGVAWEGFGLEATRVAGRETVTGAACGPCSTFDRGRALSGTGWWSGPPGAMGYPMVIAPGVHIQYGQPSPPAITVYRTSDGGINWTPVGTLPPFQPEGEPQVSGPAGAPVVFQAFRLGGTTGAGDFRIGLWRMSGILTGTLRAEPVPGIAVAADGSWAPGSLLAYSWAFIRPVVFAVNPRDPQHILAADVDGPGGPTMRVTRDGGLRWDADAALSGLLMDGGSLIFTTPGRPFGSPPWTPPAGLAIQPRVIAFDPVEPRRIFVGTEAAGVIASLDGGLTWVAVPGSRQIPSITRFAFGRERVFVASYGRGLWTLREGPLYPWQLLLEADWRLPVFFTIWGTPVFDPNDPPCEICDLLLVAGGRVRDLLINAEGRVEKIRIDGEPRAFGLDGQPRQTTLPLEFGAEDGAFAGCDYCRTAIGKGGIVRGVIVDQEHKVRQIVIEQK